MEIENRDLIAEESETLTFDMVVGNLREIFEGRYKIAASMSVPGGSERVERRFYTKWGVNRAVAKLQDSPRFNRLVKATRTDLFQGDIGLDIK